MRTDITLLEIVASIAAHLHEVNWVTLVIGLSATAFLFWARQWLKPGLLRLGAPAALADILTKAGTCCRRSCHYGYCLGTRSCRNGV